MIRSSLGRPGDPGYLHRHAAIPSLLVGAPPHPRDALVGNTFGRVPCRCSEACDASGSCQGSGHETISGVLV